MSARLAGLVAAFALLASCREASPAKAPDKPRRELFLLTALPIAWGESFGLEQPGSPALKALEADYRVTLIDLPSQLPAGALLLAAQPRALPAEELVALDQWVRAGGRLMLLADPLLEWPSALPLGDRRRSPMAFPDTGLLRHWGLMLDAPDERGPRQQRLGGHQIMTASPGTLAGGGDCRVGDDGLSAQCRLGAGKAILVADADFLNVGEGGLDGPTDQNLPALVSQLERLTR